MKFNFNNIFSDKVWNFLFSIIFITLTLVAWKLINILNVNLDEIKLFDLMIMSLATYRLTRLLIYDEIFYFVKDYIRQFKDEKGFVRSAYVLFNCPWCVGVWSAMFILIAYIFIPYGKFFILILTLSALSSFFHLIITWLGWVIDEKKALVKNRNQNQNQNQNASS